MHTPKCFSIDLESVQPFSHEVSLQGSLFFWSFIYYLSKFYEYIDTILLVLKVGLDHP